MPRIFDADLTIDELRLRYRLDEVDKEVTAMRLARAAERVEQDERQTHKVSQ